MLFPTTIAGSLPKPEWLAEPNTLWAPWRSKGDELARADRHWTQARRRPRTRAAGSRPRQRRQRRVPGAAKFLAFVVVLAGVAYLTKPLWPPLNNTVLDRVKNVQQVTPASYAASPPRPT